jgi:hypothetical protein
LFRLARQDFIVNGGNVVESFLDLLSDHFKLLAMAEALTDAAVAYGAQRYFDKVHSLPGWAVRRQLIDRR